MKYKNLTVLFKNNPHSEDEMDGGTHTIKFTDVVLMLSGDHLVLTEHAEDGQSITGKVFPLNTIHSYKAERE